MNNVLNTILAAALCMVVLGCSTQQSELPYFRTISGTPVWSPENDVRTVPAFSLTDQTGSEVGNDDVAGTPYVASFFFVSCTNICPTLRSRLTAVAQAYTADEVLILSHSVTPDLDTVDKLAAYSRVNNIDPDQWKLLTGEKGIILALATDAYGAELRNYTSSSEPESEFLHTETVFLVDGAGFVRGMYNGTLQSEVNLLMKDLDVLLGRSSG